VPRPPKAEGMTIGFLGTGVKAVDPATNLIEEFLNNTLKPDEPARFIFPLTTEEFSDSLADLARMARKSSITSEVISHTGDRNRKVFTEVANSAAKQYYVAEVWTQMELILNEAPQSALFVLWDDQREQELADICGKFMDAGIDVRDLTNNLIPLTKDEEGTEEEAQDEPEPEQVMSDGAQGVEVEEEEPVTPEDDEPVVPETGDDIPYTRTQLEKMAHAQVKDIAVGMGLAPRKARENMILAILERQGTPEEPAVASVGSQVVTGGAVDSGAGVAFLEGLEKVLDDFGNRFMVGLDDWLTKFSTAAEGFAFNTAPEAPMPVEESEPPQSGRRRLIRS